MERGEQQNDVPRKGGEALEVGGTIAREEMERRKGGRKEGGGGRVQEEE